MANKSSRWQLLKARMQEPFRVTVIREETFEEVRVLSINRLNVVALFLVNAILLGIFSFFVISLTPLKELVPMVISSSEKSKIYSLENEITRLENKIEAQEQLTMNIKNLLVGDIEQYEATAAELSESNNNTDNEEVERIPEDEELRKSIAFAKSRYNSDGAGIDIPLDHINLTAPVKGKISSEFNSSDRHFGIDIVAPSNTPIKSVLDGYVIQKSWTQETGNVIAVQHAGNLVSFYKHNSSILKKRGDFVKAGEAIAIIGNTGTRTDGPHLHFELWHRGLPVNPTNFMLFD